MPTAHEGFMAQALREARKGEGRTHPNPPVGAVLVSRGKIIARGHHHRAGAPHAEVEALRDLGRWPPKGATLYVTLEPCAHQGRTPPCVEAILDAGIERVVIGTPDPHPHTNGRGIKKLRRSGVEVTVGVREAECQELLRGFTSLATRGRPWVVLKLASTLDGRIATRTGHSQWVTGEKARAEVHRLRDRLDAILVGGGTVRADNPQLTCRRRGGRDPMRVVLSGSLNVSSRARVFTRRDDGPSALVATTRRAPAKRARLLEATGAEIVRLPSQRGRVDLEAMLLALGERGLTTVLVEGGSEVTADFLERGWVDEVWWFLAPKIVGGADAIPAVAGRGVARMDHALQLEDVTQKRFGPDWLLRGRPVRGEGE